MPEKLGAIADVHGNALALAAVLRDAQEQGVGRLVDLGDTLYGPLRPREAYQFFRGAPIVAGVAGNQERKIFEASEAQLAAEPTLRFVCDDLGDEPVAWLRALPKRAVVDGELFLCHGTPSSDTTYLLEDVSSGEPRVRREEEILELLDGVAEPVVLCGHSHLARVVRLSNGQIVVNPGSVGLPAYDDNSPVEHSMETYSPHASYAIVEKNGGGWDIAIRRVAYDWDEAARQAQRLGREDWALGLATGRMRK